MKKAGILQIVAFWICCMALVTVVSAAEPGTADQKESDFFIYLPTILTPSDILFFDNFSDSNSGWPVDDDGVVRWSYQDEEYEMLIREERVWSGAVAPVSGFKDYSVEAEMRRVEGAESDLGLIFDFQDWDNYYFFVIDPGDQWYGLAKIDNGQAEIIIPLTNTSKINADKQSNTLKVERSGNNIDIFINGQHLDSANDKGFEELISVGFYAESDTDAPATVRYDNLTVQKFGASKLSNKSFVRNLHVQSSANSRYADGNTNLFGP